MNGAVVVGSAALVISASSGSMTYGGSVPTITPSYAGFVNGDGVSSLTTPPTVLDHGHVVEPGRQLPEHVLGGGRPQLHHQLRGRVGQRRPRTAHGHGVVGIGDLRGERADHHPVVLGLRER